jgi:endonuclease III
MIVIGHIMKPISIKKNRHSVLRILKGMYGIRRVYLTSHPTGTPFKNLVGTIISQRNRDEVTEVVSKKLFRVADSPREMATLGKVGIANTIKSANFYKTKAKYIYCSSMMLIDEFKGKVPRTREELMRLPGVGGKTADIVLMSSFRQDVIPVDTHVQVVSQRLGWTKEKEPERIRADLHAMFSPKERGYVNMLLVMFGKEFCRMHLPRCYICPIRKHCPYPQKTKNPKKIR